MDSGRVSVSFHEQICFGDFYRFIKVVIRECCHDGTHFFFADEVVTSYSVSFYHEDSGVTRYEDAGFACDCLNGLSDNIPVNMPIFKKCINYFVSIFFGHDVCPVTAESVHDFLFVVFVINETLFPGTDDTIVKGATGDDFFCRYIEINKSI